VTPTPELVATAGQLACLLEASAETPGTVSQTRAFHDMRYEDFLASAAAIGPVLARAGEQPVGATILAAVDATARWTSVNTNLGIILLFAPIARAALTYAGAEPLTRDALRRQLGVVLDATTVADTVDAYVAIRRARPGGLRTVAEQDVTRSDVAPTATVREAMALAERRDRVAREYATVFASVFDVGLPALATARRDGLHWDAATTELFLTLLAAAPDTLIERKLGTVAAAVVSRQAMQVVALGGIRTDAGRDAIAALDAELRDDRNQRNPGTTADLTAATLFAELLTARFRL
jgi:triphosphoribosyl-dephospho-CoA synthase